MKGTILLIFLMTGFLPLLGQNIDEARETIRFIRLAETKKNLDIEESKLLALNERLDAFEEQRFELKKKERILNRQLMGETLDEASAAALLDQLMTNRETTAALEISLYKDVRGILTALETVQFVAFYQRFQRDVQRRIRSLQKERSGNQQGRPRRGLGKNRRN